MVTTRPVRTPASFRRACRAGPRGHGLCSAIRSATRTTKRHAGLPNCPDMRRPRSGAVRPRRVAACRRLGGHPRALVVIGATRHRARVRLAGRFGGSTCRAAAASSDRSSFRGLAASSPFTRYRWPDDDTERRSIDPIGSQRNLGDRREHRRRQRAGQICHSRARLSVLAGGVDAERYTPVGPALTRTDLHRVLCLAPNPLPCNGFDMVIGALPRIPGTEVVSRNHHHRPRPRRGASRPQTPGYRVGGG